MEVNTRVQLVEMPNQPISWHAIEESSVIQKLQSNRKGLTPQQVQERQIEFCRNVLPEPKKPTLFEIIFHQFKSPLIYILLVASAIALATGDVKDAIFILGVILLNATIGSIQEWRAEKSAHALQLMLRIQGRVIRDGQQLLLDAEGLVPGEISQKSIL